MIHYDMTNPFGKLNVVKSYIDVSKAEEQKMEEKEVIYKVNEMFESIQGEGYHTGEPVIFVRLAGCSMGCEWCDTKYCQEVHYKLTAEQILEHIEKNFTKKPVVISGGEPFEQDLRQLVEILRNNCYLIWVETNGAKPIPERMHGVWLTVSPKKHVLSHNLTLADEIKLVISNEQDIKRAKIMRSHYTKTNFYLQPESGKKSATQLCVKTCIEDPRFKLSAQVHKLIDIK